MGLFDDIPTIGTDSGSGPARITVHPMPRETRAPLDLDPRSRDLAIRTVLGEAANEPDEGQAAVAAVLRNRLESGRWGDSLPRVITAPKQFEPWNTQQGRSRMFSYAEDSEPYKRAAAAVEAAFAQGIDPTGGMTHFFSPTAQAALGRDAPGWAKGEALPIGRHTFFAPEGRVGPSEMSAQSKRTGLFDDIPEAAPRPAGVPPQASASGMPGGLGPRRGREDREVGAAEALGRGAAQGVTANFYDELRGLIEASGANASDPASLSALIKGAYQYWTGDPEAVGRYETAKNRVRSENQEAQAQRPVLSTIGEVAGAVAVPVGGLLQAPTTAARVGRSMAVGAGYGAAAGAGGGEGAERVIDAGKGGALGGVVGAAAVPAIAAVEAGARGIARAAEPIRNAIRGQSGVEREAANRVATALEKDIRAGDNALTPQQFVQGKQAGQPVAISEWGGETTRALARSAANTSSEGRAALQGLADSRFEGQAERATQFLRNLVGGNVDTAATREGLRTAARSVNQPAYRAAYSQPNAQGLWDEGFEQMAQAPVVQDAIRKATVTAANDAAKMGLTPVRPFVMDKASGRMVLREGDDGTRNLPNLQFWDHVKRELDKTGTREAGDWARIVRERLDDFVPEYRTARAGAARFFEADEAVTAGENFVKLNKNLGEARRALAKMSPEERELFRQGFAARLIDDINGTRDRVNVLNKIAQSPQARQKMEMALGPQGYQRVEAFLTVEQAMDRLRTAVQGNSTTARQLYNLGMAGGAGYGAVNYNDPQSLVLGAVAAALSSRGKKVDERVARRVAEMLTSNDPNVLAKGIKAAAGNQSIVRAFRDIDTRLARVSAQQTPQPTMLQAVGAGRAEDE